MGFEKHMVKEKLFETGSYVITSLIKLLKWEDEQNYKKNIRAVDKRLCMLSFPIFKMTQKQSSSIAIPVKLYNTYLSLDYLCVRSVFDSVVEKIESHYTNNILLMDNDRLYITIDKIIEKISIVLNNGSFKSIEDYLPNSKGRKQMSKRKYPKRFKQEVLDGKFTVDDVISHRGCHGWSINDTVNNTKVKCCDMYCAIECKLYGGIKDRSEKIKNKITKWLSKQETK